MGRRYTAAIPAPSRYATKTPIKLFHLRWFAVGSPEHTAYAARNGKNRAAYIMLLKMNSAMTQPRPTTTRGLRRIDSANPRASGIQIMVHTAPMDVRI